MPRGATRTNQAAADKATEPKTKPLKASLSNATGNGISNAKISSSLLLSKKGISS